MDSANFGSHFRARLQMPPQKDMLLLSKMHYRLRAWGGCRVYVRGLFLPGDHYGTSFSRVY